MPRKKASKKKPTEFSLDCPCGAKARIFELERGYMAHCVSCGAITFFDNPQLLERLRFGVSCVLIIWNQNRVVVAVRHGARYAG